MNILIPHKWLLEHLETNANPEEIQRNVSLCGPSFERIYDIEGDKVYDIEVTTNRVDAMSVRGIAREAAVILQQFGIKAKLKTSALPTTLLPEVTKDQQLPLPKIVNNPKLCKRVICIVLKNIKRTPTQEWMGKRLLQTEQNIHDSVIDITNYITHELGHPCHAFDYDKLMKTGGEINIVEAQADEKFTTLDGNDFTTVGGEVVFKNGEGKIIDLPSIKGTANTSIDSSTQNVLLLLESISAEKVRFASMTHAIRTTAAQLMEKHVDPHLAKDVLIRGVELYQELCGAQIASEIYDEFPGAVELQTVEVKTQTIHNYLGKNKGGNEIINTQQMVSILEQLGCTVETFASLNNHDSKTVTTTVPDRLIVHPPTFRPDLTIPADIIEEIARIYGYHKLPNVLMDTQIPTQKQSGVNFTIENRIKRFLSSIGLQEIYSYSMVSAEIAEQTDKIENHLKIQNPLSDDRVYLRKSLIPSLNEILDQNSQNNELTVFEIANVYLPKIANEALKESSLPNESLRLAIVSNSIQNRSVHYRTIRGYLENMLKLLYIPSVNITQNSDTTGTVIATDENGKDLKLGTVSILSNNRIAFELEFSKILEVTKTHPTYLPIPKTAFITEDLTFTLPKKIRVGEIINLIIQTSVLVRTVELKDKYKQNYSFTITYHDPDKNLASDDLKPIRKQIVQELEKQQGILVGTI